MNSRTRKKLYPQIVARDGEHCKRCGIKPLEKSLVIDHKNNDNYDNRLENLQLLCRSCNYEKNPRNGPVDNVCVSVCDDGMENVREMSPEMTENRRMEPLFRNWLFGKVMTKGRILQKDAVNGGAEYVSASTETIRRYIGKMTSDEGSYIIVRNERGYPCIQFRTRDVI